MILICIILLLMTTCIMAEPDPNLIIRMGYEDDTILRNIDNSGNNINRTIAQVTALLGAAGVGIGACVGIIYAIMWITATPAKKAELKERLWPLIIGIVLLFGGPGIAATFISALSAILLK